VEAPLSATSALSVDVSVDWKINYQLKIVKWPSAATENVKNIACLPSGIVENKFLAVL
jgi:hypothetical protein